MTAVHIIYASTSGNTEHVVDILMRHLRTFPDITVECQRAETANPEDLFRGDVLILCSGTWNTGGTEGQLNMHMHELLHGRAKNIDLAGKPITFISLGDERYYFRTRCTEHFLRFQRDRHGVLFAPPLIMVNEPYGQEEKIHHWADKLAARLANAHVPSPAAA